MGVFALGNPSASYLYATQQASPYSTRVPINVGLRYGALQ